MPVDADREMISSHAHGARDSREKEREREREREKRGGHESKRTNETKSRFISIILHEIHVRFRRLRGVRFCRSRSLHSIIDRRHLVVVVFPVRQRKSTILCQREGTRQKMEQKM